MSRTLTASFTGDPNKSTLVLPLTGVGTEVTFTPASLNFGNVVHGNTKSVIELNLPSAFVAPPPPAILTW